MKTKKWLSALLAGIIVIGSLAACTGNTDSKSSSQTSSKEDTTAKDSSDDGADIAKIKRDDKGIPDLQGETIKIWLPLAAAEIKWIQNYSEYSTIQNLEKAVNVKLEFVHPPVGQEKDSYSIMLNSGDWPDIIWSGTQANYPGGLDMALKDDIMLDVDPYIGDDFTPNFSRVILSDTGRRRLYTNDSGKITRLGSKLITTEGEYGASSYIGPLVRKDYLEKSGLPAPETIADWYAMLTKFKEMGVQVPYGWAAKGWDITEASNTFVSAFGINNTWMVTKDGKVAYSPITEGYKAYLTEMNKWYEEKLINPDYVNQTGSDNIYPMLSSDKVGALSEHLANYIQIYYPATVKGNPEKDLVPVQYPILNKGDELSRFRDAYYGVSGDVVITTKAKNPEACIALIDSLYNSEINYTLSGTEGVTYKRGTEGEFSIDPIWYPNDTELDMRRQHSSISLGMIIDDNSAIPFYYSYPVQLDAFALWNKASYDGNLPNGMTYTEEENAVISKYQTDIDTFVAEMKTKFIVGTEPITNFEKFAEQVTKMHCDELIAIRQASLDRFNAR